MIKHILEGSGVRAGRVGIDLGALAAITPGELDALHESCLISNWSTQPVSSRACA